MALLNVDFFSYVLGMGCTAKVILPQSAPEQPAKKPYKTLYLLHGLSDDQTAWTRWTSIERYANERGIAVVMPCVHRSFYADRKNCGRYFTFVSDEMIKIMEEMFPLSNKREDRYAAGLSMGGYGAVKLGLSCPEKFSVAASLSGALDVVGRIGVADEPFRSEFADLLKDDETRKQNDLFYLAEKLDKSAQPKPRLYIWCGTEDFLYDDNVKFKKFIEKTSFTVKYEESAGDHSWGYWDEKIKTVLDFIFSH
jgi:S-formylglutathione hydrolase FrmB